MQYNRLEMGTRFNFLLGTVLCCGFELKRFFFQLPEDFEVMFDEAAGELIIGGIYLRLFIQQPAWVRIKRLHFLKPLNVADMRNCKGEKKLYTYSSLHDKLITLHKVKRRL